MIPASFKRYKPRFFNMGFDVAHHFSNRAALRAEGTKAVGIKLRIVGGPHSDIQIIWYIKHKDVLYEPLFNDDCIIICDDFCMRKNMYITDNCENGIAVLEWTHIFITRHIPIHLMIDVHIKHTFFGSCLHGVQSVCFVGLLCLVQILCTGIYHNNVLILFLIYVS